MRPYIDDVDRYDRDAPTPRPSWWRDDSWAIEDPEDPTDRLLSDRERLFGCDLQPYRDRERDV